MDDAHARPFIPLPTPVDRRMRFGPFPSARAALKFVAYGAAGALVIPWFGAIAWLPILGAAFLLTVVPLGDGAIDGGLWARLARWQRALRPTEDLMPSRVRRASARGVAQVAPGGTVSVLRCPGRPLAFLPPTELREKFDRFRELLRSVDGGIVMVAVGLPIDPRSWRVPALPDGRADRDAARAYTEMVELLARRRAQRRVYVLQWVADGEAAARERLEGKTAAIQAYLSGLGLAAERLEGPALGAALRRFGWNEPAVEAP